MLFFLKKILWKLSKMPTFYLVGEAAQQRKVLFFPEEEKIIF